MVVNILDKDLSYGTKVNNSKNKPFWGKLFKFRTKMLNFCPPLSRKRGDIKSHSSVCLSVSQSVRLSVTKTLTFTITIEPLTVGLSYFTCTFLMMRPCHSCQNFDLVTLNVTFDLHILKLNICHNFSTIRGSAFIFYM